MGPDIETSSLCTCSVIGLCSILNEQSPCVENLWCSRQWSLAPRLTVRRVTIQTFGAVTRSNQSCQKRSSLRMWRGDDEITCSKRLVRAQAFGVLASVSRFPVLIFAGASVSLHEISKWGPMPCFLARGLSKRATDQDSNFHWES